MKFFIPTVGERYRLLEEIRLPFKYHHYDRMYRALGVKNHHVPSFPGDSRFRTKEDLILPAGLDFTIGQLYFFSSWGQTARLNFEINKRKPFIYVDRSVLHNMEVEKI